MTTTAIYPLPAPIWRRVAALLYDVFILFALSLLYGALVTGIAAASGSQPQDYQPMFSSFLFPLGWVLTLVSFYCFFWLRSGQTIGMKTWHLKLVQKRDTSRTPSLSQCILRALVAAPAVAVFGVGFIYGALHPARVTLQDKLSATRIVMVPKAAR